MSVTQFTECRNSNRMEKYGLQRVLHGMEARDINMKQIATDRHVKIKNMREKRLNISYQVDMWHICENFRGQQAFQTSISKKWIKSICNHCWWSCVTCGD